jgi:acyl-coenzyme A thioesterase PaaI-like protein
MTVTVSTGKTGGKTDDLTPMPRSPQNRCFGCGPANANGLQLEFQLADDCSVVCLATIADRFEGAPGYVHGGIIATMIDETMSKALSAQGHVGVTRRMEIDYRHMVPSGTPIRLEGRLARSEGRKHWTEATILNAQGDVLAEGTGLFIEVYVNK